MNILAIETGSTICQVGLQFKGERSFRQLAIQSHSQVLLSLVDELLNSAGATLAGLDFIAVNHGPGSFTGMRVGVSVAQGLAFTQDIPIVGVSSLQILALTAFTRLHPMPQTKLIFAAIDARMQQVYCAWYQCQQLGDTSKAVLIDQERVLSPDQLSQLALPYDIENGSFLRAGSGQNYQDLFPKNYQAIEKEHIRDSQQSDPELNVSVLMDVAEQQFRENPGRYTSEDYLLEPIYLRNNVTQ